MTIPAGGIWGDISRFYIHVGFGFKNTISKILDPTIAIVL